MVATSLFYLKRATRPSMFSGRKVDLDYSRYNHEGSGTVGRMTSSGWRHAFRNCMRKKKKVKNNATLYGGRKKKTWLATFGQLIITLEGGFDN